MTYKCAWTVAPTKSLDNLLTKLCTLNETHNTHTHTKSSHVRSAGRIEGDQIHFRSRKGLISILHAAVSLRRDKDMPAPQPLLIVAVMMKNGFVIGCELKKKRQMRSSFQHTEVHSLASYLKQSSAKVLLALTHGDKKRNGAVTMTRGKPTGSFR